MLRFIQVLGDILESKRTRLKFIANGSKVDEIECGILEEEIEGIIHILEATNLTLSEFQDRVEIVKGQTTSSEVLNAIITYQKYQYILC